MKGNLKMDSKKEKVSCLPAPEPFIKGNLKMENLRVKEFFAGNLVKFTLGTGSTDKNLEKEFGRVLEETSM